MAPLFALVLALSDIAPWQRAVPALIRPAPQIGQVVVVGTIDDQFTNRLVAALDTSRALHTVVIESNGGLQSQARQAAKQLNRRGLTIRVIGRCASACALLWAATDKRELRVGATIGLHASRPLRELPSLVEEYATDRRARMTAESLRHAGFSEALIARGLATPYSSVLWLTPVELRAAGVRFFLIQRRSESPNNSFKPNPLRSLAQMNRSQTCLTARSAGCGSA